jgi:hypothetical protein
MGDTSDEEFFDAVSGDEAAQSTPQKEERIPNQDTAAEAPIQPLSQTLETVPIIVIEQQASPLPQQSESASAPLEQKLASIDLVDTAPPSVSDAPDLSGEVSLLFLVLLSLAKTPASQKEDEIRCFREFRFCVFLVSC